MTDFSFIGKKEEPESYSDQRHSIFSTSSGISTKKVQLSSEELEMQAILKKREQKAQEKRQA
jgi:hypothetical protein